MTEVHPSSGLPAGADRSKRCGACSWAHGAGPARICLAAAPVGSWVGPTVESDEVACAWFEAGVGCDPCGACCREAFDAVPLGADDDPTAIAHPDLVVRDGDWRELRRVPGQCGGTRCAALRNDGREAPFRCVIYADRPTACRELEIGEPNCLLARRRVGLSPGPTG